MAINTIEQVPNLLGETSAHTGHEGVSRRAFMGVAAMAGATLATTSALAQTRAELLAGRTGENSSDPGPENTVLLRANPSSNLPPFTDHGNLIQSGTPSISRQNVWSPAGGRIR